MHYSNVKNGDRVLSVPTVAERTGWHPQTVRKKSADAADDFPALVHISAGRVGILESEFESWLARRVEERDGEAAAMESA